MSEVGARPRWRDALVLAVLATVIIGGLVHYGRGLDGGGTPSADSSESPSSSTSPTDDPTAQLEGAPPADPAAPQSPGGGTCWDGREIAKLKLCGLPAGARGLEWVFPSFAEDRALCHRARPNDDNYPVVESYACFQEALGKPVTITYDQVKHPAQVERWLLARVGKEHMRESPARTAAAASSGTAPTARRGSPARTKSSPTSCRSTPRARRLPSAPGRSSSGRSRRSRSAASATRRGSYSRQSRSWPASSSLPGTGPRPSSSVTRFARSPLRTGCGPPYAGRRCPGRRSRG